MDNGPLEPPGARRGRELLPEASGGSPALRHLAFGLWLQGCKQTRSCCSEPGHWGHVLPRPQETHWLLTCSFVPTLSFLSLGTTAALRAWMPPVLCWWGPSSFH